MVLRKTTKPFKETLFSCVYQMNRDPRDIWFAEKKENWRQKYKKVRVVMINSRVKELVIQWTITYAPSIWTEERFSDCERCQRHTSVNCLCPLKTTFPKVWSPGADQLAVRGCCQHFHGNSELHQSGTLLLRFRIVGSVVHLHDIINKGWSPVDWRMYVMV